MFKQFNNHVNQTDTSSQETRSVRILLLCSASLSLLSNLFIYETILADKISLFKFQLSFHLQT